MRGRVIIMMLWKFARGPTLFGYVERGLSCPLNDDDDDKLEMRGNKLKSPPLVDGHHDAVVEQRSNRAAR